MHERPLSESDTPYFPESTWHMYMNTYVVDECDIPRGFELFTHVSMQDKELRTQTKFIYIHIHMFWFI